MNCIPGPWGQQNLRMGIFVPVVLWQRDAAGRRQALAKQHSATFGSWQLWDLEEILRHSSGDLFPRKSRTTSGNDPGHYMFLSLK